MSVLSKNGFPIYCLLSSPLNFRFKFGFSDRLQSNQSQNKKNKDLRLARLNYIRSIKIFFLLKIISIRIFTNPVGWGYVNRFSIKIYALVNEILFISNRVIRCRTLNDNIVHDGT